MTATRSATPPDPESHSALPSKSVLSIRGFRYLLSAHAVTQLGTQVSVVALPLVAVLALHGSTFQVGILVATQTVGYLLIGLPAGAWVDRLRKRPIMIAADVVRGLLLLLIPLAAVTHTLEMWQLYVVASIAGMAKVMFDVSYQSSLPALVGRDHLVDANARMESVAISATLVGPAAAGWLIQIFSAPLAILIDAVSYLGSAVLLFAGRIQESVAAPAERARLVDEIRHGLAFVVRHRIVRLIALCAILSNFFAAVFLAVEVPFLVHVVALRPWQIGLIGSSGAVGGMLGALSARRLVKRFGAGNSAWASATCTWPFVLLLPLARPGWPAVLFPVGWTIVSAGIVVYNVSQVSLRQTITPDHLLGRMNASIRFLGFGSAPLGALAGGLIGQTAGLDLAIWVSSIGIVVAVVPMAGLRPRRSDRSTDSSAC
jgi:MFS family permease